MQMRIHSFMRGARGIPRKAAAHRMHHAPYDRAVKGLHMARIRTIKPEFPQSESMGRCSRDSRLLFVNLFTLVDDSGVTRGNSRMLASLLFPYDDDAPKLIEGWLTQLETEQCLDRYVVDGQTYVQIRNWLSHQKIDKPTPSKFPQFDSSREDSRIVVLGREGKGMDQGVDQGKDGKRKTVAAVAAKSSPLTMLLDLGVEECHAKDWLLVRKAKRAPLTDTVIADLKSEAVKAGLTVGEAVAICAKKSWQGFNSTWNWRDEDRGAAKPVKFNPTVAINQGAGDDRIIDIN